MELCSIRARDVRLYTSHCSLFVESSKTDQSREGAWINIARSGKVTCPVAALERYLAAAGIKLDEDLPLFRALAPPKSSVKVPAAWHFLHQSKRISERGSSRTRRIQMICCVMIYAHAGSS